MCLLLFLYKKYSLNCFTLLMCTLRPILRLMSWFSVISPTTLSRKVEHQYNYYENCVFDLKRNVQQGHEIARNNLIRKKQSNKNNYDKTISSLKIYVDDNVLIKEQKKKKLLYV